MHYHEDKKIIKTHYQVITRGLTPNNWIKCWQQTSFLNSQHWKGILGCPIVLYPIIPITASSLFSSGFDFLSVYSFPIILPSPFSKKAIINWQSKGLIYISYLYFISFSWIYLFFKPNLPILIPRKTSSERQGEGTPPALLLHPQFHLPLTSLTVRSHLYISV